MWPMTPKVATKNATRRCSWVFPGGGGGGAPGPWPGYECIRADPDMLEPMAAPSIAPSGPPRVHPSVPPISVPQKPILLVDSPGA